MNKVRGFETVIDEKRKTVGSVTLPTRGSSTAMAYDFYANDYYAVAPNAIVKVWTDVKAYMQENECLILNVRSSMGGKFMLANTQGWIDADYYTEADAESIPTGRILPVKGTPMDFNTAKPIGRDIDCDYEALVFGKGYDHNWILKTEDGEVSLVASMEDEESGRGLKVYTDLPGMQFYTGNFLDGTEKGKDGAVYYRRNGACFETQYFPDSVHHENFPSPVLHAGEEFRSQTIFHFYVME